MRAINFVGANFNWGKPHGVPDSECGSLPAKRVNTSSVFGIESHSYWKPSPEELEALQSGHSVKLIICGAGHPPVAIEVEKVEEVQ